jgi:hypothetical protein
MGRIDRKAFAMALTEWVQDSLPSLLGKQVAIDGKALRGSRRADSAEFHRLNAFVAESRLVLGAEDIKDKEIMRSQLSLSCWQSLHCLGNHYD